MKLFAVLLFALSVCVYGQTKPECSDGEMRGGQTTESEPLHNQTCVNGKWIPPDKSHSDSSASTCPKYQHLEEGLIALPNNPKCKRTKNYADCFGIGVQCVDDLHVVTEKEWQDLMLRLNMLEHPIPVFTNRSPLQPNCTQNGYIISCLMMDFKP